VTPIQRLTSTTLIGFAIGITYGWACFHPWSDWVRCGLALGLMCGLAQLVKLALAAKRKRRYRAEQEKWIARTYGKRAVYLVRDEEAS
jgi:hypothetical protein